MQFSIMITFGARSTQVDAASHGVIPLGLQHLRQEEGTIFFRPDTPRTFLNLLSPKLYIVSLVRAPVSYSHTMYVYYVPVSNLSSRSGACKLV